jgi:GcrA cell cycle regulator
MAWDEQSIEKLKGLLKEGYSAGAIAAELPGVTRNAVIGKVNRLGLKLGENRHAERAKEKSEAASKPRPQIARREPKRRVDNKRKFNPFLGIGTDPIPAGGLPDATPLVDPTPVAESKPVDFLERRMGQCAWPLWTGTARTGDCCGAATTAFDKPYCAAHAKLAFQQPKAAVRVPK